MKTIYPKVFMEDTVIDSSEAQLSVASSAVLYGLSVYTVFPIIPTGGGYNAFRLRDHFDRLIKSAQIIGMNTFAEAWTFEAFKNAVAEVAKENKPEKTVFARATVHVDEIVPGTRSRDMSTTVSIFLYDADPIVPQDGARIKTSVWRRIPDYAIPSRAKVNGAYINSVLGKQDALDSGYDDCLFLDVDGHVCELSAANIFIVRDGVLITPSKTSDILEGINRKTVIELAKENDIPVEERTIDLTELYIADEAFACGTSAFVAPIKEIDARTIGNGKMGEITQKIKKLHKNALHAADNLTELTKS